HRLASARGQPHRVGADVRGLHADKPAPAVLADIPHGARAVATGIPYDGGVRTPLFDAQPPGQHGIVDDARRRGVEEDAIRFARDLQRLTARDFVLAAVDLVHEAGALETADAHRFDVADGQVGVHGKLVRERLLADVLDLGRPCERRAERYGQG